MSDAPQALGGPGKHLRTDHLEADLEARAVRGGFATVLSQGVKLALQFAAIVILARLLDPEDFGSFAMVAAVFAVFEIFRDLGLSVATVQRPELTHRQVSTLFWINALLGTVASVAFAALAPALAWFYGKPALLQITPAVALALLLGGLSSQHLALLRRQMRFAAVALILTAAETLSLAVAVSAALHGFGLWSLVIQQVACAAATAAGAWTVCNWRPGRPQRLAEIRELVAFGGNATAAMAIGRLAANSDRILLGWYWGPLTVGLLDRAQKLLFAPIQNLYGPLASVALQALSRMARQPDRYRAAYITVTERLAMLVAPAAALMIAASHPLVAVILGSKWSAAAPILGWMGISALYMPLTYTFGWLYLSQDRTPEMLRANIVNGGLSALAIAAGLPYGATAVAAAFAVSGALVRVPILCWLVTRRGPVGLPQLVQSLALPLVATGVSTGLTLIVRDTRYMANLPPLPMTTVLAVVAGTACMAVYAAFPHGRRILRRPFRWSLRPSGTA
jgi:PST family polysaccharide transporter